MVLFKVLFFDRCWKKHQHSAGPVPQLRYLFPTHAFGSPSAFQLKMFQSTNLSQKCVCVCVRALHTCSCRKAKVNSIPAADTPDASRKLAVSTQSLASGTTPPSQGGGAPLSHRKRLLKAPTLAELESSESDVRYVTRSSAST